MTDDIRRKLVQRLAAARGLNQAAQENLNPGSSQAERTIPPVVEGSTLPLSHAQERMWFLHTLDPAASAYNVCVLWHLRGQLDSEALQRSAERVSERQGIFRTVYNTDMQGQARQEVLAKLPPAWSSHDLRLLQLEERAERLAQIAQQASTAPFDLSCSSPLRLILVALSDLHHVLVMVGQHIVWDGPSFGVFSNELAQGYNLFLKGEPDLYPPPQVQYIDFAHWHRRQWQDASAKRAAELAFWETQLYPLPEPLDFPVDFERGVGEDEAGNWCTESLDANTTAALLQLAAREQVTPFEVLIGAIALLMTRLARASEVTIGTVASHRNLPELNGAIGNFGNVVPLRLSIASHWNFRHLLQHCAQRCRPAFAHADMPFEYLLDHLNIARGATRNPLLDTMVTFLSHGMDTPAMDGLEVEWKKHFNGTSQIDLSFDALLLDGSLQLQATWRRSLYRAETVPKHLQRLAQLLRQCVAAPDAPLTELCLLLPEEKTQLTESWGARPALAADADTLVGWFENTVHKQPQAIALYSAQPAANNHLQPPQHLTFAALNARANLLARWLVSQGVGPEDRVAIALPRRPEWFVAMLATLKAGAAFVPIDPAYPSDYINRVLSLAQPLLTFIDQPEDLQAETEIPGRAISLAAAEQAAHLAGFSDSDLSHAERRQPLHPAHPVCIVFTSGSSGKPKGVVVTHSALVNLLSSHREDLYQEAYKRTGRRLLRIGHAWSLAFDASWQPSLWLFEGHELHLFDVNIMQDPIALAREIIQRQLDFIELTPGMLDEVLPWLQSGLTEPGGHQLPGHVPAILGFGGESVKPALWQRLLKLEGTSAFNLYGPTEACVDTLISRARPNDPLNIGGPVAGAQVYVLDTCLQLTPPGVAGELAIAGAGLARGYLTRGDLTASQFIANPQGPEGSRLYRTGDRVRWLPSGILEYIGRIDEQVKIRGFRVEPLEVEATVEKLAQRPCAVVARKAESGTMQLLCFIETSAAEDDTGTQETAPDLETLAQLCAASLPAHLLPKHIIPLERLPRLPNAKINRRALVMPAGLDSAPGRSPRSPLEHQLCQLMAEVLRREQVGIDDGFFELGGDSISVIKLVSLARRDGLTLTARQVFDSRCVVRLASLLESLKDTPSAHLQALTHDSAYSGRAMPTPLMARYLSLNLPLQRFAQIVSLALPPGISDPQLAALLKAVLQRHPLLRASLATPKGGLAYLEIPADDSSAKISLDSFHLQLNTDQSGDLQSLPAASTEQLERLSPSAIARHLCNQLDPRQGRMLAAARVQDGQHHSLWLAVNHLVIDVSSWHILAGDLALARAAQELGEALALPPVATAWRSWSAALPRPPRETAAAAVTPRGTLASARRISWILPLYQGQCPAATAARRLGLPLASLLPAVAALAALRAKLVPESYQQRICLAVERHGREPSAAGQDLSRTLGWFAREVTLPLALPEGQAESPTTQDILLRLLRQWCAAIAQLDQPAANINDSGEYVANTQSAQEEDDWQLGFNFLGDFAAPRQQQSWAPQPRMELLVDACGDHWPLLHDLDINAHYADQAGSRLLRFDALGPASSIAEGALERLFAELQGLLNALIGADIRSQGEPNQLPVAAVALHEVTPLQYEILRQCQGQSDPWTTQMELCLQATPEQPLTAASLRQSATQLLARHEALRAGFLPDSAATFIAHNLAPDWQSQDWRGETEERQHSLLAELREHWYSHTFRLDQPPLVRFMALQLSDNQWRLLVNCHHLLLDGWSVPRVLHEWLGGAAGQPPAPEPELRWTDYLDWLQAQDRGAAWRYWNDALAGLKTPSLLCPGRSTRTPSQDLLDTLTPEQSKTLVGTAKKAGVSPAALFQLAWAHTLVGKLGHSDIVFGLFDSGRAAPLDGLATLVGLVTQLVPLRIDTAAALPLTAQLRELQARQFEWQALAPVRLDNLQASHSLGEFFDTLLVVENALEADSPGAVDKAKISPASTTPLSMLQEQLWQDSIGQAAGLFIYPRSAIELRLCHDPKAINPDLAGQLLAAFKQQLQDLTQKLDAEVGIAHPPSAPAKRKPTPELTTNSSGD